MRRIGKVGNAWIKTRKQWIKDNPPTFEGYYFCQYCGLPMTVGEMTLDHVIPKGRAPHLRHEYANLVPCCGLCNSEKGSK